MRKRNISVRIGDDELAGQLMEPKTGLPGILFIHGWAGSQKRDARRSQEIARLGCICLTFDMRGHGNNAHQLTTVTPADNLADIHAAYDVLASHPAVDKGSIAVVGSSYGGYLSAFLAAEREVRWLALRVPALYRDEDWAMPKHRLDRAVIANYRKSLVPCEDNAALRRCRAFTGDVLIVESERDDYVPHPTVASYLASFTSARSITYRVVGGADHALSTASSRRAYDALLLGWIREMIFSAR